MLGLLEQDELISVSAPVSSPPLIEYKSIQPLEDGAILSIDKSQDLYASEDGLIIYTGHRKKTGKTLSILYDTGETATYGFVDEFHQLPYTTVNAGDIFASVENEHALCSGGKRWRDVRDRMSSLSGLP